MIVGFFVLFFTIRLIFLAVSIRHEKQLRARGATQIGAAHSSLLAAAHIVYYFAALLSACLSGAQFNGISLLGVLLLSASFAILYWIVRELGEIWTVKVYILPEHPMNRSWLFATFRHPNYYLNIIPELIGMALLCQAWWVLLLGLPLYGLILAKRIRQEEAAMKHLF